MKKHWITASRTYRSVVFSLGLFLVPLFVNAQLEGGTTQKKLEWGLKNPLGAETLQELILQLTNALVLLMSPVIVLMLIYSGYLFVVGANQKDGIKKAKDTLLWTIAGAAIILGAKGIAMVIQQTIVQL